MRKRVPDKFRAWCIEVVNQSELAGQPITNSKLTLPSKLPTQPLKMAARQPQFNQKILIDTAPLPSSIPPVTEIGSSSAPLLSASFFIGDRCKAFNDDYMVCKTEANGRGEFECMKEGRKVTRCAASVLDDINKSCLTEFRKHWECLEKNNQQMWHCRRPEMKLNTCVFDKLQMEKKIPGTPEGETPVHLRTRQIYSQASRFTL